MDTLQELIIKHRNMPFPRSVDKGVDYGAVDPVMIDADIYGWALRLSGGAALSPHERAQLEAARADLAESLAFFPDDAQPYYETLLKLATAALA